MKLSFLAPGYHLFVSWFLGALVEITFCEVSGLRRIMLLVSNQPKLMLVNRIYPANNFATPNAAPAANAPISMTCNAPDQGLISRSAKSPDFAALCCWFLTN